MATTDSVSIEHLTASGAVVAEGTPVIVYSVNGYVDAGSCRLNMRNGGATSDILVFIRTDIANHSKSWSSAKGFVFNNGLYISLGGGGNKSVTIEYEELS